MKMTLKQWIIGSIIFLIIGSIIGRQMIKRQIETVDTMLDTKFEEYEPDLSEYVTKDEFDEQIDNISNEILDTVSTTQWILEDILGYHDGSFDFYY